jgi:hypothetical protein
MMESQQAGVQYLLQAPRTIAGVLDGEALEVPVP